VHTSAGYRVLAFDFYGFGFSEAPLGVEYTADLFVQQAHELLGHIGSVDPITLAGHSMGGLLAAVFAVGWRSVSLLRLRPCHVALCVVGGAGPLPRPYPQADADQPSGHAQYDTGVCCSPPVLHAAALTVSAMPCCVPQFATRFGAPFTCPLFTLPPVLRCCPSLASC
jgi:pimeloyl-ACP methyl ester carboxylesterase